MGWIVDDPTNKPEQPADASGDPGISQADIDALMGGGAEPESASAPNSSDDASGSDGGEINQADIDALMSGEDSGSEPVADASPPDTRVDTLGRPFDEAAAMMQAAIEEEKAAAAAASPPPPVPAAPIPPPPPGSKPVDLPELDLSAIPGVEAKRVTMLNDVKLGVRIELGRTRMLVEDVLKLGEGSVVELDKLAGDPVDVYVNDRLIARGEVLVLNDNFCVRISDVLSDDPHRVIA